MSVEEVCRKYNTDCVQVRMGRARAEVGALGLREQGWRLSFWVIMDAGFDLGCQGLSREVPI